MFRKFSENYPRRISGNLCLGLWVGKFPEIFRGEFQERKLMFRKFSENFRGKFQEIFRKFQEIFRKFSANYPWRISGNLSKIFRKVTEILIIFPRSLSDTHCRITILNSPEYVNVFSERELTFT